MNKGFTLVELLAVIVILSIVMGIGVVTFSSITNKSNDDYYHNLEINLEMAASNYFSDYRSLRPAINISSEETNACSSVSLQTLVDNNYIESVNDANGKTCSLDNSKVYIKRNENKQYEYKVQLSCDSYSNLLSNTELNNYCLISNTNTSSSIMVSALVNGNSFDVKRSSGLWTNNNIVVTFDSVKTVSKYVIINRQNNDEFICDSLTGYKCSHTFNNYGSFHVSSYDGETLVDEITIYTRIDKDKPVFNLNFTDNEVYVIESGSNYQVNFSLTNIVDVSGISLINYQISNYYVDDFNAFINKDTSINQIKENFGSGVYTIKIKAFDNASNESDEITRVFRIARKINLVDLNNNANNQTFNVINNYAYNYLNNLPVLNDSTKTFLGWYTGISGGIRVSDDINVDSTIDTLYARWGD